MLFNFLPGHNTVLADLSPYTFLLVVNTTRVHRTLYKMNHYARDNAMTKHVWCNANDEISKAPPTAFNSPEKVFDARFEGWIVIYSCYNWCDVSYQFVFAFGINGIIFRVFLCLLKNLLASLNVKLFSHTKFNIFPVAKDSNYDLFLLTLDRWRLSYITSREWGATKTYLRKCTRKMNVSYVR